MGDQESGIDLAYDMQAIMNGIGTLEEHGLFGSQTESNDETTSLTTPPSSLSSFYQLKSKPVTGSGR